MGVLEVEAGMGIGELTEQLKGLQGPARDQYHVELRAVFGSEVRGQARPGSDVDVLVEFDQKADLFDYVGLAEFLEEALGRPVDVVPIGSIRAELKERILSEAVYL